MNDDEREENMQDMRGKCRDIDDPEAGESVRVPHASYDLSSFEMQQNDRCPARRQSGDDPRRMRESMHLSIDRMAEE
ncbi:hypothetical protein [Caballeronia sp. Lep1P3]|uniref:hypothetical protein n=1 Tax=Caballeronia sp. Lep1P3 TaxID=2878150 RepID=UPI001FD05326|nr:hypothetical protein [Caballeronia sp. Lep1P3]